MGTGRSLLAGATLAVAARLAKRGVDAFRSGELQDFVSKLGTGQALAEVRARFEEDEEPLRAPRRRERERTPAPA